VEASGQADPTRLRLVSRRREVIAPARAQRVDRADATGSIAPQSVAEKKDDVRAMFTTRTPSAGCER
jgi:hypothetical protein